MKKFYERYWKNKEKLDDFSYKWPVVSHFIPKQRDIKLLDFGCGKGKILKKRSGLLRKSFPNTDFISLTTRINYLLKQRPLIL